jgi:hypothetical protein
MALDGAPANVGSPAENQNQQHFIELKARYDGLKGLSERVNCEGHWQEVAELVSPRKVDFVGLRTPGDKRMQKVYDSTGITLNETLAAGLHGMATNPASKWFSLRMVGTKVQTEDGRMVDLGEIPNVQKYLSDVEEVMWARLYQPGTNFTTGLHETYLDLGAFGTSIMFLGQRDDGGLLFETRALAECVVAENSDGRVDTVFRSTTYTVRQMVQMVRSAGWTISSRVKDLYEQKKFEELVKVIHAVYPREERDVKKKNVANMKFASCYFEHEDCHQLQMGGFPEFPYLVARWGKYAGEVYGRSPGMTALPDIKMLQAMELTKIKLIQKAADPPMWLKDDGVVGQTRTVPGGINYWRGNPSDGVMLQPVNMAGIQYIIEDQNLLRERISRTFFADLMRMTDRADMTATEVVHRTAEQMRLFGPLIGRLESELLGPMVERVFGILSRLGLLPPPPKEIQGHEFTVEYVSPIATAQKQQSANGIMQAAQVVMSIAGPEMGAQIMAKIVDMPKLGAWAWDLFNNDPDLLVDEEQIAQSKQLEQAQQAMPMAQQGMDMASQGAGAMKSLAEGDASTGGGISKMISTIKDHIAANPQAQQGLESMLNGQSPN